MRVRGVTVIAGIVHNGRENEIQIADIVEIVVRSVALGGEDLPECVFDQRLVRTVDDQMIRAEPGAAQILFGVQPVKGHPGIFPWLRGIGPVENGLAGKAGEKLPGGDAIFASVGAEPALAAVYTVQLIMLLDTGPPGVCCGAFLRPVIEQLQITVMAAAGTFIQLFSMEFRCKRSPRFDCALSWNIPRIIIENMHVIFKIFFVSGFPGAANGDFAQ